MFEHIKHINKCTTLAVKLVYRQGTGRPALAFAGSPVHPVRKAFLPPNLRSPFLSKLSSYSASSTGPLPSAQPTVTITAFQLLRFFPPTTPMWHRAHHLLDCMLTSPESSGPYSAQGFTRTHLLQLPALWGDYSCYYSSLPYAGLED